MSLTDYLVDSLLVLLVLRQIRETRLDRRAVLLPLVIVGAVAHSYLSAVPTGGNNLALIAAGTAAGIALGVISGLATRVRSDGGRHPLVKAGWVAAGSWVLGMGFRFAFAVWASNGGAEALGRFSAAHHISAAHTWTDALVLMALGEVLCRTAVLWLRGRRVSVAAERPALVTV